MDKRRQTMACGLIKTESRVRSISTNSIAIRIIKQFVNVIIKIDGISGPATKGQ